MDGMGVLPTIVFFIAWGALFFSVITGEEFNFFKKGKKC